MEAMGISEDGHTARARVTKKHRNTSIVWVICMWGSAVGPVFVVVAIRSNALISLDAWESNHESVWIPHGEHLESVS